MGFISYGEVKDIRIISIFRPDILRVPVFFFVCCRNSNAALGILSLVSIRFFKF